MTAIPAPTTALPDTPRIRAAAGEPTANWEAVAERLFDEGQKLERELIALCADNQHMAALLSRIEREDQSFAAACDANLTAIASTLAGEKSIHENLSATVARLLAERNQARDRCADYAHWAMSLVPTDLALTYVEPRQYVEAYVRSLLGQLEQSKSVLKEWQDAERMARERANNACAQPAAKDTAIATLRAALHDIVGDMDEHQLAYHEAVSPHEGTRYDLARGYRALGATR